MPDSSPGPDHLESAPTGSQAARPLGQTWLSPKFLVPLGMRSLTFLEPSIFLKPDATSPVSEGLVPSPRLRNQPPSLPEPLPPSIEASTPELAADAVHPTSNPGLSVQAKPEPTAGTVQPVGDSVPLVQAEPEPTAATIQPASDLVPPVQPKAEAEGISPPSPSADSVDPTESEAASTQPSPEDIPSQRVSSPAPVHQPHKTPAQSSQPTVQAKLESPSSSSAPLEPPLPEVTPDSPGSTSQPSSDDSTPQSGVRVGGADAIALPPTSQITPAPTEQATPDFNSQPLTTPSGPAGTTLQQVPASPLAQSAPTLDIQTKLTASEPPSTTTPSTTPASAQASPTSFQETASPPIQRFPESAPPPKVSFSAADLLQPPQASLPESEPSSDGKPSTLPFPISQTPPTAPPIEKAPSLNTNASALTPSAPAIQKAPALPESSAFPTTTVFPPFNTSALEAPLQPSFSTRSRLPQPIPQSEPGAISTASSASPIQAKSLEQTPQTEPVEVPSTPESSGQALVSTPSIPVQPLKESLPSSEESGFRTIPTLQSSEPDSLTASAWPTGRPTESPITSTVQALQETPLPSPAESLAVDAIALASPSQPLPASINPAPSLVPQSLTPSPQLPLATPAAAPQPVNLPAVHASPLPSSPVEPSKLAPSPAAETSVGSTAESLTISPVIKPTVSPQPALQLKSTPQADSNSNYSAPSSTPDEANATAAVAPPIPPSSPTPSISPTHPTPTTVEPADSLQANAPAAQTASATEAINGVTAKGGEGMRSHPPLPLTNSLASPTIPTTPQAPLTQRATDPNEPVLIPDDPTPIAASIISAPSPPVSASSTSELATSDALMSMASPAVVSPTPSAETPLSPDPISPPLNSPAQSISAPVASANPPSVQMAEVVPPTAVETVPEAWSSIDELLANSHPTFQPPTDIPENAAPTVQAAPSSSHPDSSKISLPAVQATPAISSTAATDQSSISASPSTPPTPPLTPQSGIQEPSPSSSPLSPPSSLLSSPPLQLLRESPSTPPETPQPSPSQGSETVTAPTETEGSEQSADILEALAREIYGLLQQRLEIERERQGSRYSGRLPW